MTNYEKTLVSVGISILVIGFIVIWLIGGIGVALGALTGWIIGMVLGVSFLLFLDKLFGR